MRNMSNSWHSKEKKMLLHNQESVALCYGAVSEEFRVGQAVCASKHNRRSRRGARRRAKK